MRACIATMLDLEIDAVPNFIRFDSKRRAKTRTGWFEVFYSFLHALGYEYQGMQWPKNKDRPHGDYLKKSPNINGLVMATVPSRTFKDIGHSVVVNLKGIVVHDPNPNKLWQGINVLKSKDLQHWMMIQKKVKR